jgi:hypothetical protein
LSGNMLMLPVDNRGALCYSGSRLIERRHTRHTHEERET